jgi:hypothetical protein
MTESETASHVAGVEKPENLKRRKHLRNKDSDVRMILIFILISCNLKWS